MLWLDFETRSRCDLTVHGVYNYVLDASTEVLCMSYAFDDEDVQTWTPDQEFPSGILHYTGQIRAHNAAFERLVLWNVLNTRHKLEQFYCTAAQARANCLPGSLEDVGRAISSKMQKDHRGSQLIRALSIPRADGTFNEDKKLMDEMIAYCEQDVRTMRAVSKGMRDMSLLELADYHVNERINDRGVLIDRELVRAARRFANVEMNDIHNTVREVTNGELTSVRSPKMRQWVYDRVGPRAKQLMQKDDKTSIDKSVRAGLLAMEDPDEVPPDVMDVIQCADDIWASSVAKFQRLDNLADLDDDRVRGAFVFNGGSATGRASSFGAQVHNFTRKCAKEPEAVRQAMVRGHEIVPKYGKRVTDVLKGMLRPSLIPEKGKLFVVADWSAIEARCNPWLANDPMARDILDVFENGGDVYIKEAAGIYRVPEEEIQEEYDRTGVSERRQVGKVAILSLGYGGSVGAFNNMARAYGIVMGERQVRGIVDAWRRSNIWAVNYWQALESAYMRAIRNPKHEFTAGRVTYMHDGTHLWYSLPSKRILCYPFAKIEGDEVTYVKASWKPAADAKEWPRARLWRGLAAENICQATANDLLRHSLRQLDDVVLHVHDEIVAEVNEADAEAYAQHLKQVMCTPPEWAAGLPLNAEVKIMGRYGK